VVLQILAALSIVGGWVGITFIHGGDRLGHFLEPVFADAQHLEVFEHHGHHPSLGLELGLGGVSLAVAIAGILLALLCYRRRPELASRLQRMAGPLYPLLLNKYYFDELYDRIFVRPLFAMSRGLFRGVDETVIEGIVNGLGGTLRRLGQGLRPVQSGYVRRYAMIFAVGVVLILGIVMR
jgi:NADH-quinone oxidoreductase subunit L